MPGAADSRVLSLSGKVNDPGYSLDMLMYSLEVCIRALLRGAR